VYQAARKLPDEELAADRKAFFGSILGTLSDQKLPLMKAHPQPKAVVHRHSPVTGYPASG
jgi:hypothetical protein